MRPENQQKVQFRRSLINIEEAAQDDELDAILGELSVLGSQLESEIGQKLGQSQLESSSPEKLGQSPVAPVASAADQPPTQRDQDSSSQTSHSR